MGSSCSCNNYSELKQELDMLKEKKKNRDFFIDYSIDNNNQKQNIENDNVIKIIKTNSMNSNNNDFGIFSTKSYSNNNIYNIPIYRSESFGTGLKQKIFEENKSNDKNTIIVKDEDNNINAEKINIKNNDEEKKNNIYHGNGIINENGIIIEDEEIKNNDKNSFLINNEEDNNKEGNHYKTQIQLKPKKKVILPQVKNNSIINDINNNINKDDYLPKNYNTGIFKNKVIYSCSTDIITTKKYKDDYISEEEYSYIPEDDYSRIIFDYINKLRTNPKSIASLIDENKKYIFIEENNDIYFKKNNKRYLLFQGYPIFIETINILNNLEPMNKLVYNKNITIKRPDNEDYINNLDYLKFQVEELQNNGNHISSYWKEKIKDPEIVFLMMVIDDNNIKAGLKRKDLINPEIKYIGISSVEIDDNFACYITLSNRK